MSSANVSQSLKQCDVSIQSKHPSMIATANPVVARVESGEITAVGVAEILGQYSFLPAVIVEFLSLGADRLSKWPKVEAELARNLGEERGSRTNDQPHYEILKEGLLTELSLDVSIVKPSEGTKRFLDAVRSGLSRHPLAFSAGVLYALEASAIPELSIVADIINHYAALIGLRRPIDLHSLTAGLRVSEPSVAIAEEYSLDAFFDVHLHDFEVGHKNGLKAALQQDLHSPVDIRDFELGFEYLLDAMDQWWESLSSRDSETDATLHNAVGTASRSDETERATHTFVIHSSTAGRVDQSHANLIGPQQILGT